MTTIRLPPLVLVTLITLIGGSVGDLLGLVSKAGPLVSPGLLTNPKSNIMVSMKDTPAGQLAGLSGNSSGTKSQRATKVTQLLKSFSALSQAPVLAALGSFGVKGESFWISNQIFIKDANPAIVTGLMGLSSIMSILEEMEIPIMPIAEAIAGKEPNGTQWNVEIVGAHKVWEDGTTGEGILVGGIDTGVRVTHSTLKENYVGKLGWHDPYLFTSTPSDLQGHGTHTMGTIVGQKGIGIAPGAKWMACKGCLLTNCNQHTLLACGQFMLCPSSPGVGKNKEECEGTPDVVNNSWGTGGGEHFYDEVVKAWLAAGIKPFFAQGNAGPKCVTGGSPADNLDVISVGSTDKDDKISKFSSRGPTIKNGQVKDKESRRKKRQLGGKKEKEVDTNIIKPEICAPGDKVNSADMLTDNAYKVQSGTSMATPAACGVAALLLSKNPEMDLKQLKELLYTTTDQKLDLTPNGAEVCGPVPADQYPNHMCGHGRVNAWNAYQKLKESM